MTNEEQQSVREELGRLERELAQLEKEQAKAVSDYVLFLEQKKIAEIQSKIQTL